MQCHKNSAFNKQTMRSIGYTASGGAELSECLSIVSKIKSDDYQGWHDAWKSMATQLEQAASHESQQSSLISAGQKLLRASNYYRTAYFFLEENPEDRRIGECLSLSKEAFKKALDLLQVKHIPLSIPFEDGFLPGYLYLANQPTSKLLLDSGGGDGTLEELYFTSVVAALKRGYNCLTVEGPGQGSVLRIQKKPFRHDWEIVIKTVLDYLEKNHPEVSAKVALRGDSFGGYLAARAVAYEKRIQACILNPAILNPRILLEKLKSKWKRSILFFLSPDLKFTIESRYMRFGAHSFTEMYERLKDYNLEKDIKKITCPVFVMDNEEEHLTRGEALKLYEDLQSPKKYVLFKKGEFTGGHCQPLSNSTVGEMVFDWLDTTL